MPKSSAPVQVLLDDTFDGYILDAPLVWILFAITRTHILPESVAAAKLTYFRTTLFLYKPNNGFANRKHFL